VQKGDVVLRRDNTAAGQSLQYARVVKVLKGTDRMIGLAEMEYKLLGKSNFRITKHQAYSQSHLGSPY
jgi:hypothetical protein